MKVAGSITNSVSGSSWIPYSSLTSRIDQLAKKRFEGELSKEQYQDLRQAFKLAQGWIWPAGRMKGLLSEMSPELMKAFMVQMIKKGHSKEIHHFLKFVNEKVLLELSGFKTSDVAVSSFKLHGLSKSTALANGLEKEGRAIIKEFFIELKHFLHHLLEVFITLSGINEIQRQRHQRYDGRMGEWEAKAKLEAYMALIAYPAAIFAVIYTYIQIVAPAILLTSLVVVVSLTALVAYNRYGKPCPIDHQGLQNLTLQVQKNNEPIYPRMDLLKKIEAAFEAKKGVLLVGEPGCGKSLLVLSLVQQILAGKICPFIKDPQFFSANASSFKVLGNEVNLSSIENRFDNYKDQVGFFFDEFAAFFKSDGLQGTNLADEIKTFWEKYRYTIGATTRDEYNKYVKDQPAIAERRFEVIDVGPMDELQIEVALLQSLQGANFKIKYDPTVFQYIIAKMRRKKSIIDSAKSILNAALKKMTAIAHTKQQEKVSRLQEHLHLLTHQAIAGCKASESKTLGEKLIAVEKELANEQQILAKKEKQTEKMLKMENQLVELKKEAYQLSDRNIIMTKNSSLEKKWMRLHTRIHLVETFIADERKRLGFPHILDASLIDSLAP